MSYFDILKGTSTGTFYPLFLDDLSLNASAPLRVDVAGNLITRSAVLTDEGSLYDPFAGDTLSSSTWTTNISAGGTVTVANSLCTITNGGTANELTSINRVIDYAPLSVVYYLSVPVRQANQDIYFGIVGAAATSEASTTEAARFRMTGADTTKIRCVTQSSADTGGTSGANTDIILPRGYTTDQELVYKIDFNMKEVRFYVGSTPSDLVPLLVESTQSPNIYTQMKVGARIGNGATPPVGIGSIVIDSIYVSNNNIVDIQGDITGNVNIDQHSFVSSVNSSTTNIGAGSTFTGAAESALDVAGIQVSLKADQNCIVYVDQSPDGTNWDISDEFEYYYSIGNFGITVQAIASYFRVRVANIGFNATTVLRLHSILCPIVEAVPRSLSDNGYLKTSIFNIEDHYGFEVENTPMGEMRVVTPTKLVGAEFDGNSIDTNFWTPTVSTGATATNAGSQLTMSTGTTANASSVVQTLRRGRYVGGASHRFRTSIRVPDTGITSNTRKWGAFDGTNGAYFVLDGSTFGVATMKAGTATTISSGNFNGPYGSVYILDTNIHTYEIYWTNNNVRFAIDEDLIHTVGAATTTWSDTLTLPVRIENVNRSGLSTNVALNSRVATIYRLGQEKTRPIWKNFSAATTGQILKNSAGTLHSVIINKKTGTTITLYDALSATNPIASIDVSLNVTTLNYNLDFYTGLYAVVVGSADVTVVYE